MMTLITGGAKCGKSKLAEKLLDSFMGNKIYMAAMLPYGEEAEAAIKRHRKLRKGKGFTTIEKYTDIEQTELPENCAVLLECMANLCANLITAYNTNGETPNGIALSALKEEARKLL